MVKDAEAHAEEDLRKKEEAELRNNADMLVHASDKLLAEQGEKVTGPEKDAVEETLAALKAAIEGGEMEAIKTATDELGAASQAFSAKLYEQASAEGAAPGGDPAEGAASGPDDDEVVDAEIIDDEESE